MSAAAQKMVLYIEDNPVNVFLVQSVFQARPNVKLLIANNGSDGLAVARQYHPALILLDLNLPDMDGAEFLRKLRGDPAIAPISVVIVSADAMDEHRRRLQDLGIADYVTKPLDLPQFEHMVDRHLNR